MFNRSIFPAAIGVSALLLTGCVQAQATEARIAGSTAYEVAPDAVGNTVNSTNEVSEALSTSEMRSSVRSNLDTILTLSQDLNTPYEFERDLFVCEELHPLPADHRPEHPESEPLTACVEDTFNAYEDALS